MDEITKVLVLTLIAGGAMPAGGFLARIERISPNWLERDFRHGVIAFGGGVLLAAVALVLVPEGIESLSLTETVISFLLGGLAFFGLDKLLARMKGSMSQMAAMLADFVPEAMAMGASFAGGKGSGLLLAFLIALQNLPEGFNAYREIRESSNWSPGKILIVFAALVPLGPCAGAIGYFWLAPHPRLIGCIMLFAASGILYLTFEDLAPQAQLEHQKGPAIGAVLGFLMGLIGHSLLESH